ncbi:amidohydrolase family protein [Desulfococcaceae bacterium HSG9]|nr:amidohydrolase family protein [Desulfococcaceae bacterium HSG9]
MTLFLRNTNYLNADTLELRKTHLAVEPGPAGGLTLCDDIPSDGELSVRDKVVECRGRLVTKSFACGHHHIYSTLARGMPAPPQIPANFLEVLKYVWWRVDKCLDRDMIKASAQASALYMAKHGVTFCIDHHSSPYAIEGSLETIAQAFEKIGLGHLLCYENSCRDGQDCMEAGLAETDAYLSSGRKGHIGLHASFTVDDNLLKKSVALARKHGTGLHIHVAEDLADQEHCLKTYGKRVIQRLYEFGALESPHTILGHCVFLDDNERKRLRESPVWVVQNVESNQNNNVGVTGYTELTDNVMLGTDGMHSDMLRSAKAAYLAGQNTEGVSPDQMYKRFRNAHRFIKTIGAQGDGANNLVILDYDSPTQITSENFTGHFIYGLESSHVRSVIAQGKMIVEEGRVISVDEAEILAYAREQGLRLWKKLEADIV